MQVAVKKWAEITLVCVANAVGKAVHHFAMETAALITRFAPIKILVVKVVLVGLATNVVVHIWISAEFLMGPFNKIFPFIFNNEVFNI